MKYSKDKKGEGSIFTAVLVIMLCLLTSLVIVISGALGCAEQVRDNVRLVLDGVVNEESIRIYNSVKVGNDGGAEINSEYFIEKLCKFCTLEEKNGMLYHYSENGEVLYYITCPRVVLEKENTLKTVAEYDMYFPLKVGPFEQKCKFHAVITSKFNEKFEV